MPLHTLAFAASAALALAPLSQAHSQDVALEHHTLDNGVRVLIGQIPASSSQCTFTFLPLTLVNDEPRQTQWAHLLEHMMIRSTDSHGLVDGGIEMNGETGSEYLRLDTYAAADVWKESLTKHAQWLTTRAVDADSLAREKRKINTEINTTIARGFTHKWAAAAWCQIIRHAQKKARPRGDIDDAPLDVVQAALSTRIPIDESVLIASFGPVKPQDVLAELAATIGSLPRTSVSLSAVETARFDAHVSAEWDVSTRHLLLWWKLPDEDRSTLLAARAATMPLTMQTQIAIRALDPNANIGVSSPLQTPEGAFVLINIALSRELEAQSIIDTCTERIALLTARTRYFRAACDNLALNLKAPDAANIEQMRRQTGSRMLPAYAIANLFLPIASAEYAFHEPAEDIRAHLSTLPDAALQDLCELLSQPPHGSLTLVPTSE